VPAYHKPEGEKGEVTGALVKLGSGAAILVVMALIVLVALWRKKRSRTG
jgi:hypothetical protein